MQIHLIVSAYLFVFYYFLSLLQAFPIQLLIQVQNCKCFTYIINAHLHETLYSVYTIFSFLFVLFISSKSSSGPVIEIIPFGRFTQISRFPDGNGYVLMYSWYFFSFYVINDVSVEAGTICHLCNEVEYIFLIIAQISTCKILRKTVVIVFETSAHAKDNSINALGPHNLYCALMPAASKYAGPRFYTWNWASFKMALKML